jgi:murein DD-endopeptidase MepM/ murein hydrolase activator NlpD
VSAAADGTVINNTGERCIKTYAFILDPKKSCDAWGWVGIDHGNGYISQYGHLQVIDIKVIAGQTVQKGQLIGLSGNTAPPEFPVGPHLHFEVLKYVNGEYFFVDPYGWSGSYPDPLYCPDQQTCLPTRPASTKLWE